LDGLALAAAGFQEMQIILHVFVAGVLALGGVKLLTRAFVIAAQHVGIVLVVQDLGGWPNNADRLSVGAVGGIEAAQAIIGRGQTSQASASRGCSLAV
jgi:hypothetical protein